MNSLTFLVGLLMTLVGLLLIGAQVNKHQIRPWSVAAWVLRIGVLRLWLTMLLPERDPKLTLVVRILGVMLVAASIIMVNHEWVQSGDKTLGEYHFTPTPDMLFFFFSALLANVVLLIGLAQQATWLSLAVPLVLVWMVVFGMRLTLSQERVRAGFKIIPSLSAQVFMMGIALLVWGTWLVR